MSSVTTREVFVRLTARHCRNVPRRGACSRRFRRDSTLFSVCSRWHFSCLSPAQGVHPEGSSQRRGFVYKDAFARPGPVLAVRDGRSYSRVMPEEPAHERDSPRRKPSGKRRGRRKSRPVEFLMRDVEITSFNAHVSIYAMHEKGEEPYIESGPWLELYGVVADPIRSLTDVEISLYPRDTVEVGPARPATVGSFINMWPPRRWLSSMAAIRLRQSLEPGTRWPPEVRIPDLHKAVLQQVSGDQRVILECAGRMKRGPAGCIIYRIQLCGTWSRKSVSPLIASCLRSKCLSNVRNAAQS